MNIQKYEKYIKMATSTTSVILPVMTMPQLLVIWMNQDASNVSLLTWSIYLCSAITWLLY